MRRENRHPTRAEWERITSHGKAAPVEREEFTATLPGKIGLECVFSEYIAHRTVHLREQLYVTFVVEGGEFRPAAFEHSPRWELMRYQLANAFQRGEQAYGQGRPLEVSFVCYSPEGSGAAAEAVREIGEALTKLREVAEWPERKRSWFGIRHGATWTKEVRREASVPSYRPPEGALPYRDGPPVAENLEIRDAVRGHLERWGLLEDWEKMQEEREQRKTEKLRERRRLEELERQADPFGFGPEKSAAGRTFEAQTARWDELATPPAWEESWWT